MMTNKQKIEDGYLFGLGIMKASAEMSLEEARYDLAEADPDDSTYNEKEVIKAQNMFNTINTIIEKTSDSVRV